MSRVARSNESRHIFFFITFLSHYCSKSYLRISRKSLADSATTVNTRLYVGTYRKFWHKAIKEGSGAIDATTRIREEKCDRRPEDVSLRKLKLDHANFRANWYRHGYIRSAKMISLFNVLHLAICLNFTCRVFLVIFNHVSKKKATTCRFEGLVEFWLRFLW